MTTHSTSIRDRTLAVVAWFVVGACVSVGLLLLVSALFVLALPAIALAVALALRVEARLGRAPASWATLVGLAVTPTWLAVDNWGGPGERCSRSAGAVECAELFDPLPWLVAAVTLLALGLLGLAVDSLRIRRRRARDRAASMSTPA